MEKLAKKLSVFVFLFACLQLSGAPLNLLSISPHTQDMYASPPPHPYFLAYNKEIQKKSCEKVATIHEAPSIKQISSQNEKVFLGSLKEVEKDNIVQYSLIFLYSISLILILLRVLKLFYPTKEYPKD